MKVTNVRAKLFHQTMKSAAFLPRFAAQLVKSGFAMPTRRTSNGIPASACPVLTENRWQFHCPLFRVTRLAVLVGVKDDFPGENPREPQRTTAPKGSRKAQKIAGRSKPGMPACE